MPSAGTSVYGADGAKLSGRGTLAGQAAAMRFRNSAPTIPDSTSTTEAAVTSTVPAPIAYSNPASASVPRKSIWRAAGPAWRKAAAVELNNRCRMSSETPIVIAPRPAASASAYCSTTSRINPARKSASSSFSRTESNSTARKARFSVSCRRSTVSRAASFSSVSVRAGAVRFRPAPLDDPSCLLRGLGHSPLSLLLGFKANLLGGFPARLDTVGL